MAWRGKHCAHVFVQRGRWVECVWGIFWQLFRSKQQCNVCSLRLYFKKSVRYGVSKITQTPPPEIVTGPHKKPNFFFKLGLPILSLTTLLLLSILNRKWRSVAERGKVLFIVSFWKILSNCCCIYYQCFFFDLNWKKDTQHGRFTQIRAIEFL